MFNKELFDKLRIERPIPEAVRRAVLKRADGRCESCGTKCLLELHHETYLDPNPAIRFPDEEPIFGKETEHDLRALCRECHHGEHIDPYGAFNPDIDEVKEEHAYREHMDRD